MKDVLIHEVGLRDGLQIERQTVPFEQKIRWAEHLMASGVDIVQLGSFVNPEKVPQMADTDRLFAHFLQRGKKPESVVLSGLVLNEKGLDRGLACGVELFCMGVSASDTHSRKNTGMGTLEATGRVLSMAQRAVSAQKQVQVSVQSAFGCGYEGAIPPGRVFEIVRRFLDAGLRTISLADTAGHATPPQVETLFSAIFGMGSDIQCACHLHDTYGFAMANAWAAMKTGVKCFDTAIAGLGGCPFTAVTGGNLCTEDFVHLLQKMNVRPDIDLHRLIDTAAEADRFFQRTLPGRVHLTGPIPAQKPGKEA